MLASIYLDHVFRRAHAARAVATVRVAHEPDGSGARPARRRVARAAARHDRGQLPRRGGEACDEPRCSSPGGAGFIGSNLVRALLERGDTVRVLDNFSTGFRGNLEDLTDDVEMVEGDLRSYERVHAAVRGVEVVFHQGALPSVPRSVQDPLTTTAVNVEGTLNVLLAARDEGVRRVVSASSSSVYGNSGTLPRTEDQAPGPDLPLRGREARRRAVLHELQPRVRDGDRVPPLLQRVRPAAGPELAVRGRRAPLHQRDRRRSPGHDPRRRRAVA